MPIYLMTET